MIWLEWVCDVMISLSEFIWWWAWTNSFSFCVMRVSCYSFMLFAENISCLMEVSSSIYFFTSRVCILCFYIISDYFWSKILLDYWSLWVISSVSLVIVFRAYTNSISSFLFFSVRCSIVLSLMLISVYRLETLFKSYLLLASIYDSLSCRD